MNRISKALVFGAVGTAVFAGGAQHSHAVEALNGHPATMHRSEALRSQILPRAETFAGRIAVYNQTHPGAVSRYKGDADNEPFLTTTIPFGKGKLIVDEAYKHGQDPAKLRKFTSIFLTVECPDFNSKGTCAAFNVAVKDPTTIPQAEWSVSYGILENLVDNSTNTANVPNATFTNKEPDTRKAIEIANKGFTVIDSLLNSAGVPKLQ